MMVTSPLMTATVTLMTIHLQFQPFFDFVLGNNRFSLVQHWHLMQSFSISKLTKEGNEKLEKCAIASKWSLQFHPESPELSGKSSLHCAYLIQSCVSSNSIQPCQYHGIYFIERWSQRLHHILFNDDTRFVLQFVGNLQQWLLGQKRTCVRKRQKRNWKKFSN